MRPSVSKNLSLRYILPRYSEVALAPEMVKRGKHTFFDTQRAITVLPLYIALMRFLINMTFPMYPMPAIML